MKVNVFLTVIAVMTCVIVGVLFSVFGFGLLNIVCTEVTLLPAMLLLMGLSWKGSERVSMLIKTVAGIAVPVALAANAIMGAFSAGAAIYVIIDGLLLAGLALGAYFPTRINQ